MQELYIIKSIDAQSLNTEFLVDDTNSLIHVIREFKNRDAAQRYLVKLNSEEGLDPSKYYILIQTFTA